MCRLGITKGLVFHERHYYSYIDFYLSISPCTYYPLAEANSHSEDASTATNHYLIGTRCLRDWRQEIGFRTISSIPQPH